METAKETAPHPFERTLGPGPYRFLYVVTIHVSEERGTQVHGSSGDEEGIGTCCHCGMGIMNCYVLRCGDGKKRAVGSDCIAKSNLPYEVKTAAHRAKLARDTEARAARKQAKHLAAKAEAERLVSQNLALFKLLPHPMNRPGGSFLGYVEWVLAHSSNCVYILGTIKHELKKQGVTT